ncbi:hypothetical protein AURDEDRAFT_129874 [Auricularia subglabra TFB-10046 SS5]|nr:hypothetical protein AURDEDRAFT_129874 [Auricularia subglabra TFB-10046 SS5]
MSSQPTRSAKSSSKRKHQTLIFSLAQEKASRNAPSRLVMLKHQIRHRQARANALTGTKMKKSASQAAGRSASDAVQHPGSPSANIGASSGGGSQSAPGYYLSHPEALSVELESDDGSMSHNSSSGSK